MTNRYPFNTHLLQHYVIGGALILIVLMISTLPVHAVAPQLRPFVEVDGDQVKLGDLFDFAGRLSETPVLYAPAPGEQVTLKLEQIRKIALRSGLQWEPLAPFGAVVITRAHRTLDRNEIIDRLRAALSRSGAPGSLTIDFSNPSLQVKVPRGRLIEMRFESVEYEPGSGRFSAVLVVDGGAGFSNRTNLFGRAYSVANIPVLRTRLKPDEIIRDSDITWIDWRSDELPDQTITDTRSLIGLSPIRTIRPGQPIASDDIGPPVVIQRGAVVTMHYRSSNMHLIAMGRSQDAGALGSVIRVQNANSRIIVDAIVTGANRVDVKTMQTIAAAQ